METSFQNEIIQFLNKFNPLNEEDKAILINNLHLKKYKKGEHITVEGQIQKELLFVVKGVQMSYFETLTKMQVIAFTYPVNVCGIPDSFLFQTPSKCYLTCLTDTITYNLTYENLQQAYNQSPNIERAFRKLTEITLAGILNKQIELQTTTIEERFRLFCKRSSPLLQSIPHKYIASYLGINPTNFSKLYNSIKI